MPPCLILRSGRRDALCHARYRGGVLPQKHLSIFINDLYVVAYQQNLHFKQWFKVVELMGYEWAKDLEHVAFRHGLL